MMDKPKLAEELATAIVFRTVQEIVSLSHFYSQHDDQCIGALVYSANRIGKLITKDEARTMVPALREALENIRAHRAEP